MKLIKSNFEIIDKIDTLEVYKKLEKIGRVAYKSEDKITDFSYENFLKMIIKKGHLSVLEHVNITGKFICDRGVSHELVRHRIASYTQESTRYCNYAYKEMEFIIPSWIQMTQSDDESTYNIEEYPGSGLNNFIMKERTEVESRFFNILRMVEADYSYFLAQGWTPQEARSILPNCLKTELVSTFNLREWLHIFELRCASTAHPDMQRVMKSALAQFNELLPLIFNELYNKFIEKDII